MHEYNTKRQGVSASQPSNQQKPAVEKFSFPLEPSV